MAASKTGVNMMRVFFYAGNTIESVEKGKLVALAYAAARELEYAPKALLIRSGLHNTTTIDGQHVKDDRGWHCTFAMKNDTQVAQWTHIAAHGYTTAKNDHVLKEATFVEEKKDSAKRRKGKPVWPHSEDDIEEYVASPIGYSHVDEDEDGSEHK